MSAFSKVVSATIALLYYTGDASVSGPACPIPTATVFVMFQFLSVLLCLLYRLSFRFHRTIVVLILLEGRRVRDQPLCTCVHVIPDRAVLVDELMGADAFVSRDDNFEGRRGAVRGSL